MRPPPSWLLTVVASMLMTSSTVMGGLLTVGNGCPTPPEGCKPANKDPKGTDAEIKCDAGLILEHTVLDASNLLKPSPSLKAACYPKCHPKFRINECLAGSQPAKCMPADIGDEAGKPKLSCAASDFSLFVNGGKVESHITCDVATGWNDKNGNSVIAFTADHHISVFCQKNPPTVPAGPGALCDATSFENECGSSCTANEMAAFDPAGSTKLKCPPGSKLMYGSKALDRAECVVAESAWNGFKTAAAPKEKLMVIDSTLPKLRVTCQSNCVGRFENTCRTQCPPVRPSFATDGELTCADALLQIDGSFYTKAKCDDAGWKAGGKLVVDYTNNAYAKLRVECKLFDSMFEIDCPKGVCEKPKYDAKKLTCEKANYALVVNKANGEEIVAKTDVVSTATGWKIPANPTAVPPTADIILRGYSQKGEKLKASCFSRCHIRFVDTTCTEPCNKPIYLNEGQPLFCKNADEELFLNGKQVPDVECNAATGGWREAGKPTGNLLVDFNSFKEENVKAECKKGVAGPTPFPPLQNVTYSPASKLENKIGMQILIGIVVVLVFISGGLGLFLWRIQRKKRDDDEEGHSKTKTKSNSKNNSSKNKKGKKGKKNSKNTSKKGKKGKKEKEKSKKEKKEDIDSNVEVPEHQMSEANSTVPLTAALGAAGSPQNPNVMDV